MQDLEKLVDVAIDLRIATLKAREQGIIGMSKGTGEEEFQIFNESQFKELLENREYAIKSNAHYKNFVFIYEYKTKVAGLNFICLTNELLFEGDEDKIEDRL